MERETWRAMADRNPAAVERVYQCEQATEILGRTRRIVDRVMPLRATPNGYFDPEGFISAARLSSHRRLFARSVQQRIAMKVGSRDSAMTPSDKGRVMDACTIPYRSSPYSYTERLRRISAITDA